MFILKLIVCIAVIIQLSTTQDYVDSSSVNKRCMCPPIGSDQPSVPFDRCGRELEKYSAPGECVPDKIYGCSENQMVAEYRDWCTDPRFKYNTKQGMKLRTCGINPKFVSNCEKNKMKFKKDCKGMEITRSCIPIDPPHFTKN